MKKLNPEKWLENYGDYLYGFAYARINTTEIAEDLVQETLLNAYKSKDKFKGNASEKTWLTAILKNKIIDHYRKTRIRDEEQTVRKETPISFFNADGYWQENYRGTDWRKDASTALESDEFFAVFNACLQNINERARTAFSLKYLDDQKSETICKLLQITPSNYWVLLHRTKLKLKDCLEVNWFSKI